MAASDGIVNRFVLGAGQYFIETEVLRCSRRGLAVLRVELDALGYRICDLPCGSGVGWSYSSVQISSRNGGRELGTSEEEQKSFRHAYKSSSYTFPEVYRPATGCH